MDHILMDHIFLYLFGALELCLSEERELTRRHFAQAQLPCL